MLLLDTSVSEAELLSREVDAMARSGPLLMGLALWNLGFSSRVAWSACLPKDVYLVCR